MNIDNILVARNKRLEIMQKIQKTEKLKNGAFWTSVATWMASVGVDSVQPGSQVSDAVGLAVIASVSALVALYTQQTIRKKSLKNIEYSIIEEGTDKEKHNGAQLRADETRNNRTELAYVLTGAAVALGGFQVIEAIVPSLGVAAAKAAVALATSVAAVKLGSNSVHKAAEIRQERLNLVQRIAKRKGVDLTPPQATKAAVKLK